MAPEGPPIEETADTSLLEIPKDKAAWVPLAFDLANVQLPPNDETEYDLSQNPLTFNLGTIAHKLQSYKNAGSFWGSDRAETPEKATALPRSQSNKHRSTQLKNRYVKISG